MSLIETITIRTGRKIELIPLTDRINSFLKERDYKNGLLKLFVPHTTAGLTINENADPDVCADLEYFLHTQIPAHLPFRHFEGNSPAHIWSSIIGVEKELFVVNAQLFLGTWQGIFFCEFDGPRTRKIHLFFQTQEITLDI